MMLDRFIQHTVDPLALMSNVAPQQYYSQSSTTPPPTYVPPHFVDNTQLDSDLSLTDNLIENLTNTLALLTQSYKACLPQTNNQLRTSSNTRNQATVQDGKVVVQNVQGRQNRDNVVDEDVDEQPVHNLALNVDNVFQADDCDAFDSNVDDAPTAQTMFMANLSSTDPVYDEASSSYDSDILFEVHDYDHYQDAVCEHHEVNEMHDGVQPNYVVDSHDDYTSDSNIIPYDQYVKYNTVPVVKDKLYKQDQSLQTVHMLCKPNPYYDEQNKVAIGYKNPLCLTRAKQVQLSLYNSHEIIKTNHVLAIVHNSEDTLEIAEITRKKINDKMNDPECVKKKVKIAPPDSSKENYLATFTP
ncbi:hypothetical protein Tco_0571581 [Tanacetum coccineum]